MPPPHASAYSPLLTQIRQLLDDIEIERNRVRNLEAKVEALKDTTAQGEMQKQIESLRSEVGMYKNELEASLTDKEQIEVDLENVYRALEDANDRQEERLMEAIAKERQQLKQLEVQVKEGKHGESEAQDRYKELEGQKEELEMRLNQAEDWNAVYEEGHGLKDAVRYQKKLKADIKRRDFDLSQLSERLGEELDKRKALETACQMLKEKAGLPRDFAFDDKEIKEAMVGDAARLEAENKELSKQIDMLESDRLKLMRQLRDNAAQIGEKGIRFWGLSAGQLMKVTEFATNLRDGLTELPLDDQVSPPPPLLFTPPPPAHTCIRGSRWSSSPLTRSSRLSWRRRSSRWSGWRERFPASTATTLPRVVAASCSP